MKKVCLIAFAALYIALQSCATVFSGTKCKVKVNAGNPVAAKVYVNGNYEGTAPCKVKLSKGGITGTKIEIRADGYETQTVTLTKKIKVGAIVGNILFTGGLGLIVDFLDGAIWKAHPNTINYELTKKP